MSGGVDSSVAALSAQLRAARYRAITGVTRPCVGATLKLFDSGEPGSTVNERGCCSIDDVKDAQAVCQRLELPHYTLNYKDAFEREVIAHFAAEYQAGRTPNPCIECNRKMKFDRMFAEADAMGFETLVTGHYAQIKYDNGEYYLKKAVDETKDQSYVLYMLPRDRLKRVWFPLGDMRKHDVRQIAHENGFVNAAKRDSQDICFVPNGDYGTFLEHRTGKTFEPGDFVDLNGNVLGSHRGAIRYTVGQRRGLGVSAAEPLYVHSKLGNTVVLTPERELYNSVLYADNINVLVPDKLTSAYQLTAKTRYRQPEQPCTVQFVEEDRLRVQFTEPQRAITPGQAVVLYDGDTVIAGGTITDSPQNEKR
jgi:tRNA-specific 2-thiouridylase